MRPQKATVDYFPHYTTHGKTIFVLESLWGNDGYAAWFKILERLGATDNHFIDCNDKNTLHFLAAYCRVNRETLIEILDTLSDLDAIDKSLWRQKLIFCQNFVNNVAEAYRRRAGILPTKKGIIERAKSLNQAETKLMTAETELLTEKDEFPPGKERKGKERGNKKVNIVEKNFSPPKAEEVKAYMQEIGYRGDPDLFIDFYSAKGWMIGKNKMKDWKAAVRTWKRGDNGRGRPIAGSPKASGRKTGFIDANGPEADWLGSGEDNSSGRDASSGMGRGEEIKP